MQINDVEPIPNDSSARVFYPWKDLTEVGMSFYTDSVHARQLVYAANKAYEKRGEVNRFKVFNDNGRSKIFRIK